MFFIPYGTVERTGRRHFPYVNVALVLINVIVFAVELYVLAVSGEHGFEQFLATYSFVPSSLAHNFFQFTLISALFLHAGLLHIAGNMLYLLPFGDNVEDRLGHLRYLIFYLLCGITATLVYTAFNVNSTVPLLGASGAIAGVLGGYLALNPTKSQVKGFLFLIILLIPIRLPALFFIGYWFLMQVFSSLASLGAVTDQQGGVAFLAHVGGFIAGLILAPLMARTLPDSPDASQ